jgi:hypothetical protein
MATNMIVGQDANGNLQEVKVKNNTLGTRVDPDDGGLSSATKPTNAKKFDTFYEFDTAILYVYDGISTWWPV